MRRWDGGVKEALHIKSFVYWLLHVKKARASIWEVVKYQNDCCISYSNENSLMMSELAFPLYIDKDYVKKSVFNDVVDVSFEGLSFKAMKGYDEWLKNIYGDYMTPPPIEMQKRGHSRHIYYWK